MIRADSIKQGVGAVFTLNPKASVIIDARDSSAGGVDYGACQTRLKWGCSATPLHRQGGTNTRVMSATATGQGL